MSELLVDTVAVTLRLSTLEKVGSVHGDLSLPRSAVAAARVVDDAWHEVHGIRSPGYGMPGHAMLGTFRSGGTKDFVDVRHGEPGVVIDLRDQDFARLIVSFATRAEAEAAAARLR